MAIQDLLAYHYGYSQFRPGQEEIVEGILAGKDVLGVLPTGGGQVSVLPAPSPNHGWLDPGDLSSDFPDEGPSR